MTKSKTNNRSVSVASAVLSVKDPSGISPPCYFVTLNKRSPVNDETLPPAATKRTKADTISTCKKSVVNSYEDIDLVTGRLPDDYVFDKLHLMPSSCFAIEAIITMAAACWLLISLRGRAENA